jgi:hypothetical protein
MRSIENPSIASSLRVKLSVSFEGSELVVRITRPNMKICLSHRRVSLLEEGPEFIGQIEVPCQIRGDNVLHHCNRHGDWSTATDCSDTESRC